MTKMGVWRDQNLESVSPDLEPAAGGCTRRGLPESLVLYLPHSTRMSHAPTTRTPEAKGKSETNTLRSCRYLAQAKLVAIFFSTNAWFFGKRLSKINHDKCLKLWGSKINLAINRAAYIALSAEHC